MENNGKIAVKITSDGLTSKITTNDGRDFSRLVSRVELDHEGGDLPRITLSMSLIPYEIEGRAAVLVGGKAAKRIEYVDGTEDVFGA